jgi:multidrug efflux pump
VNISEPFIRRPIATILLTVGVALAGVAAFFLLPVSPLPQVDFPVIFIQANLPGASPETMATSVATPLEKRLGIISDVSELTSQSRVGQTTIVMQFNLGRDIDGAARDVEAGINAARVDLPQTLRQNPIYRKANPADTPIIVLALTSKTRTPGQIYDVADTIIQQQISQVKGVGNVTLGGSSLPAVRVELNPLDLARYGIGLEDVRAALSSANANQPKGVVQEGALRYQIYTNDTGLDASAYAPLVIAYRNGAAVRLRDVARVVDGVENVDNVGLFKGQPAIIVQVTRQPGANIIDATDRVKALIPTLQQVLPPDIDWHIVADRTITIRASLAEVERTVIISTILVVAVVAFFLRNGRAILIPSVAVTVSLLGALGAMYLLGFSLDNLSLMALTVSTGFVVDDAIVVLENITRHVEAGMNRFEAALLGAREVGFTVFSISISLVAVFLPILLMGGIVGRLFREFAATLSAAVLVSLVISLTTTPMMSAYLVDRPRRDARPSRFSRFATGVFDRMQGVYERALDWALDSGPLMLVVLGACIVLTVFLFGVVKKGFFPIQDTGLIQGGLQTDQSSSFSLTAGRLRRLVNIVGRDPSVEAVAAFAGNNAAGGFLITSLKPRNERKGGSTEVVQRLRPKLARVIGTSLFLNPAQDIRVGGRSSNATYQYTIEGPDLPSVRLWAGRLAEAMKRQPAIVDVNTDQEDHGLESYVHIEPEHAGRLHMTNTNIDNNLYDEFGQRQVSTIYKETNQYHIVMEADPKFTQDPTALPYVYMSTGGAATTPTSPITTTAATGAPAGTTAVGASSSSTATGAPQTTVAIGAPAQSAATGAPSALAGGGGTTASLGAGLNASSAASGSNSLTTLGLTAAPGPTNVSSSAAAVVTTATPNNAPVSANAAGVPGGLSATLGTDVAVGVAAVAGPAAPPGRAASQGVAVSTTPEQIVPLQAFTRWNDQATPTSVNHQDTEPATTVSFNLAPGASLSDATTAIARAASQIGLPADVHGSFQGTARVFQQSLADEPILILASLIAIYIVLGILYESYIHPLTVLSTLPSAGTGALIALIIFHIEFDIIGMIGLILLIGIVKKNAIMMIDFALEAERGQGLSPHDSIRQAALIRFRPIMMTTFAAILGALPLAIGGGEGAELRRPLGITIIGGLLVSQLITLLTTPVVYLYLDRLHNWRRRGGRPGPAPAPAPEPLPAA